MRNLIIGIDSGTQSTKVLVIDAKDGKVLASASQEYELLPGLPPGAKEQHPHTWREAAASGMVASINARCRISSRSARFEGVQCPQLKLGRVKIERNISTRWVR